MVGVIGRFEPSTHCQGVQDRPVGGNEASVWGDDQKPRIQRDPPVGPTGIS